MSQAATLAAIVDSDTEGERSKRDPNGRIISDEARAELEQWPEDLRDHPAVLTFVNAPEDTSGEVPPADLDERLATRGTFIPHADVMAEFGIFPKP